MNATQPELPAWVTLLLIPAAIALWNWWKADGWPALKALVNVEARTKREALKAASIQREERFLAAEERFLAAYEQTAQALADIARNSEASAQALRVAAETRVLDNLTLQRVERRLDAIEDVVGRAPPVAVRRRTEGERGE